MLLSMLLLLTLTWNTSEGGLRALSQFNSASDCDCSISGSTNNQCDADSGRCECFPNYQGLKCDDCTDSTLSRYWSLRGGDSYIQFNEEQLRQQNFYADTTGIKYVAFNLNTKQRDSLLLFVGQSLDQFFALEIRDGKLLLSCNFGWDEVKQGIGKADVTTRASGFEVRIGIVNIGRNNKMIATGVNGQLDISITFSDWTPNVRGDILFGGIKNHIAKREFQEYVKNIGVNYLGCIRNLAFHIRRAVNVREAHERVGVLPGCINQDSYLRFRGEGSYIRATEKHRRNKNFLSNTAGIRFVTFTFITEQRDALLFLIGGSVHQFIALEISEGKLHLFCNFGWDEVKHGVSSNHYPDVSTFPHVFTVNIKIVDAERSMKMIVLTLNCQTAIEITFSDWAPNIQGDIWFGGIKRHDIKQEFRRYLKNIYVSYHGCVKDLTFNTFNSYDYRRVGLTPGCSYEDTNTYWRFRGGDSYIQANEQQLRQQNSYSNTTGIDYIELQFLSKQRDGLLFFIGESVDQFIALELKEGKLHLACNFGWDEPKQKIGDDNYPDLSTIGKFLTLKVSINSVGRTKKILVDLNSQSSIIITFTEWTPNIQGDVWFGGIQTNAVTQHLSQYLHKINVNYRGCITNLAFNPTTKFNIEYASKSVRVTRGCDED